MQYGPAHDVVLEPGWLLRGLAGTGAGARELAALAGRATGSGADLVVEARATDGLIEAFRVAKAPRFALAVQWHPEWKVMSNPFSKRCSPRSARRRATQRAHK